MTESEAVSEDQTGTPTPIVYVKVFAIDNGMENHKIGSYETFLEISDNSGSTDEDEIRKFGFHIAPFVVDSQIVIIANDQCGQSRYVEQPMFGNNQVVGITSTNREIADVLSQLWGIFRDVERRFDATSHIGEASQPRTSRASLNKRLCKGSRI